MSLNDYVRRMMFEHTVIEYYDLTGHLPKSAEIMMNMLDEFGMCPIVSSEEQGTRDALVELGFVESYSPFPWISRYYRITPKWEEYLRCKNDSGTLHEYTNVSDQ